MDNLQQTELTLFVRQHGLPDTHEKHIFITHHADDPRVAKMVTALNNATMIKVYRSNKLISGLLYLPGETRYPVFEHVWFLPDDTHRTSLHSQLVVNESLLEPRPQPHYGLALLQLEYCGLVPREAPTRRRSSEELCWETSSPWDEFRCSTLPFVNGILTQAIR